MTKDLPYLTLNEAHQLLGDKGGRLLASAHVSGRITLRGNRQSGPRGTIPRADIPREVFDDFDPGGSGALRFNFEHNSIEAKADSHHFSQFERGHGLGWDDVNVAGHEIEKLKKSPLGHRQTSVAAETNCLKWLTNLMRDHPQPHRVKSDYREEARQKFSGLSGRAFVRAWDGALKTTGATEYSKAGRRSQKAD